MQGAEIVVVVGLLGSCLVALILVLVARREAGAQRTRATADVAAIKDEARSLLADVERRSEALAGREQELAAERRSAAESAAAAERRTAALTTAEQELAARRAELDRNVRTD